MVYSERSMKNRNVKIIKLILCVSLGILISGCEKRVTESEQSARNMEDFEAAWNRINDVYPFFEFKKIDWDSMYTVFRPRTETANIYEFHPVLTDLLAELKDGHVYYETIVGSRVVPYYPPRQIRDQYAFSLSVVKTYFNEELRATENGSAEYGILQDNIGYIFLSNFGQDDLSAEFPDILEYLRNTKGLIIDIRQRRGGSIQNVEAVVARFIASPLAWPRLHFLGEIYPMSPLQPRGPFTYANPVVVLINGSTFSAGELTTEILKTLPNVTAVGDTTGGGGGTASNHSSETVGEYTLPSGMVINIPTGYFERYDGQHYEWLGVPPDIRVEQTEADIQNGNDRQLEYAMDILK